MRALRGSDQAGDEVEYDPECKSVMHPECAIDTEDTEASPIKPVQAGITARYVAPTKCYACDGLRAQIKIQHVTICDTCAEELIAELKARRS